jgi:hypothetical protein
LSNAGATFCEAVSHDLVRNRRSTLYGEIIDLNVMDDPILRENRRSEVARRLIAHGVRTRLIMRLTVLTHNRLATVRRRLMVRDKGRRRGPMKSSLSIFLGSPRARAEGAALVSFCAVFGIPIERHGVSVPSIVSLDFTEQLCETYEAYRACFPGRRWNSRNSSCGAMRWRMAMTCSWASAACAEA